MKLWTFLVGYAFFVALLLGWVELAPQNTAPLNFLSKGKFFNVLILILFISPLGWGVTVFILNFTYKRLKHKYSWFPYDEEEKDKKL